MPSNGIYTAKMKLAKDVGSAPVAQRSNTRLSSLGQGFRRKKKENKSQILGCIHGQT
jgi:hypothetical protein